MLPYQEQYIRNAEEIGRIWQFTVSPGQSFEDWHRERLSNRDRMDLLKKENARLLEEFFYPALDSLYEADADTLRDLEAFGDRLLDWKTNMDCGVYVTIHDALLAMMRVRRDRDGVIRELYRLGMGLYYLNRILSGIPSVLSSVSFCCRSIRKRLFLSTIIICFSSSLTNSSPPKMVKLSPKVIPSSSCITSYIMISKVLSP